MYKQKIKNKCDMLQQTNWDRHIQNFEGLNMVADVHSPLQWESILRSVYCDIIVNLLELVYLNNQ